MITVDKDHISRLMLFEAYAEKHQAEEKIRLYHQKYSRSFDAFEDHIQNAAQENFENFDDYIEWKAYRKIEKAFSKSSSGPRSGPDGPDDDIPF